MAKKKKSNQKKNAAKSTAANKTVEKKVEKKVEEKHGFNDSGFVRLLRKIDLCWLVPYMIYTFVVIFGSLFIDYDRFVFHMPFAGAVLGFLVLAAISIYVYRNYRKDTSKSKWLWIHLSWFIFIPILINSILLTPMSSGLYDFSGDFFGGLGQGVIRMFLIGICVVAFIVFCIGRYASWKREEKGKEMDTEMVSVIKDFMNVVLFIVCVIVIGIVLVKGIKELGTEAKEEQYADTVSGFTNQMLEKLPEGCDINTIATDAKMVALITEKRAAGELDDEQTEETIASKEVFVCSTVSKGVMDRVLISYQAFAKEHTITSPFSEAYYEYAIDIQEHTFTFGFRSSAEIKGINRASTFVCVYDTDWNLKDAYVMEGILNDQGD